MNNPLIPKTRKENFLAKIAENPNANEDMVPKTRTERLLNEIAARLDAIENGGGSNGGAEPSSLILNLDELSRPKDDKEEVIPSLAYINGESIEFASEIYIYDAPDGYNVPLAIANTEDRTYREFITSYEFIHTVATDGSDLISDITTYISNAVDIIKFFIGGDDGYTILLIPSTAQIDYKPASGGSPK